MKMTRGKISVLFLAVCFFLILPMQAMAQTADATANAGASAGATAIGTNSQATGGAANVNLGVGLTNNSPSSATSSSSLTNNSPSSASAGVSDVSATTGGSSAELHLTQTSTSTGSRIPVQPAGIPGGPVISNFGPVGEAWNIGSKSLSILCSVKSEWTMEEAMALYNRNVYSASKAVFCFPAASKVKVIFHNEDTAITDMRIVGTISVKGDEKANSFDAFSRAIRDTAKMGGSVLLITRMGGQCRVETSGWGIGIGGLQSTTSSGDGRLGTAGYGGTGYSQAGSMYVGMPFLEGIALRGKIDAIAAETKAAQPAVVKSQKKAPMGMFYDEHGNIQFERAYGAGVINGN